MTIPTLRLIFLFYLVGLIEHFKVRPTKLNGRSDEYRLNGLHFICKRGVGLPLTVYIEEPVT